MTLFKQVLTIFSSILYGCIFYLLVLANKKVLFNKNIIKRILSNIIFIIDMVLIYFIIMRYINDGTMTHYSYLLILLGVLIQRYIIIKIKTYKK
jgi:hypothetical protein